MADYPKPHWMSPSDSKLHHVPGTYWKIKIENYESATVAELKAYLKEKNHYYPSNARKEVYLDLACRCERGLLSYGQYSAETLRGICMSRGLLQSACKSNSRAEMVLDLQMADNNAVFGRFLDLPAEIRNAIYEYHIKSFRTIPPEHRQPPIAVVSRQLRLESLPLFYKFGRFSVQLRCSGTIAGWMRAMTHVDSAMVGLIRHFDVSVRELPILKSFVLNFDAERAGRLVIIPHGMSERQSKRAIGRRGAKVVNAELEKGLRAMMKRRQTWQEGWRWEELEMKKLIVVLRSAMGAARLKVNGNW